jgi:heptosyltransferase-2
LHLNDHLSGRGLALLGQVGVASDDILVGVHAGAAYGESKRWFPSRFAAVLEKLHRPGRRFLLLGGPGEEEVAEAIEGRMSVAPVNLVGKTSVAEVVAVIAQCDLFLSNDSGLMHVAAALGIPQVALFASSDPKKTAPLNSRAEVIHPEHVSCTPCFKRHCHQDLQCMEAITVDEVWAAAERLLLMVDGSEAMPESNWSR